jgi:hypothetical protein
MSQSPDEYRDLPEGFSGVTPNVSACKTIGTLNIIFGALLLLMGVCCGLQFFVQSTFAPAIMAQQQQQFKGAMEAARQQQIQRLKDEEKAAKSDKEKAEVEARRKKLEARPEAKMPDFSKMYGTDEPRVIGYWITDLASGVVLNLLMLIAGIGLVAVQEWGRKLGIWIAALKIVRLIALYGFNIIVIVPIVVERLTQGMKEMMEDAAAAQGGGPPPLAQMATVMGTFMTAMFVATAVLGAIYPVATLIVLTRPSVKAACTMPRSDDYQE